MAIEMYTVTLGDGQKFGHHELICNTINGLPSIAVGLQTRRDVYQAQKHYKVSSRGPQMPIHARITSPGWACATIGCV